MSREAWQEITSELAIDAAGLTVLRNAAKDLAGIDPLKDESIDRIRQIRRRTLEVALNCGTDAQAVRVCASVLADLRGQGWGIRVRNGSVEIKAPEEADDPMSEKARVRAGLLVERDQQLSTESVRRFVRKMERRRVNHAGNWVSVFSLMRDGRELAARLRDARAGSSIDDHVTALRRVIKPYIQIVDDSACPHTGLKLKEIWRYFRHTWASPHKTLPGRNLWILIRDAAADHHPVVGIAALGSAVVQLRIRDQWIGWTKGEFIQRMRSEPTEEWARWVENRLEEQCSNLYVEDLLENGVLRREDLATPTPETVVRLRELSADAREKHRLYGSASDHKGGGGSEPATDWEERARTHLFTSKRAATLADVLEDRSLLQKNGFRKDSADGLAAALSRPGGRKAVARILRRTKAEHVGIDMLDITVCGAVAPYNHILGGKLVSLLLASSEVRDAYRSRYEERASVIASGMAGTAVRRPPRLVLLGTTSLYGVGSSQYNRLRMPAEEAGGTPGDEIRYAERGVTEGYGSFHFSSETLEEIRTLYAQTGNGRRVKHIFGEGANPRMREVREALDRVGLPSDRLLRHGSSRVVYVVPLATNFREVLLGRDEQPEYIIPAGEASGETTQAVIDFWVRRWLSRRVMQDRILNAVEAHSLSYPIEHGARVPLPPAHEETPLFASTPME